MISKAKMTRAAAALSCDPDCVFDAVKSLGARNAFIGMLCAPAMSKATCSKIVAFALWGASEEACLAAYKGLKQKRQRDRTWGDRQHMEWARHGAGSAYLAQSKSQESQNAS